MNFKYCIKLTVFYWLLSFSTSAKEGMPQFDVKSFPSQLFWLVLTFTILYVIVSIIILPRIRENIRLRKNKILDNLERAETIKTDIENMIQEYDVKIIEAKENVAKQIKKSILKSTTEFNSQIDVVKKQVTNKQKEFEKKLINYKIEIEENTLDSSVSIAVLIINKIINKKINTNDLKPLLGQSNSSKIT